MDILNLAYRDGASIYYDEKFRAVLEDHMTYFRTHATTTLQQLEAHEVNKWRGDLFGFLNTLKIPAQFHWLIMRMNAMSAPTDLDVHVETLLLPSTSEIEKIRSIHAIQIKSTI